VEKAEEALSAYQKSTSAIPLTTEAEALLRHSADLGRERVLLQVKRDQLAQTLTPNHPELAAVLSQLATVERAIGRVGGTVNRLPVQQRDLLRLQRDVQIDTQLYTTMLTQAQQLRIAQAGWLPNARLVDAAVVPVKPVRPSAVAVMSIGAGLALVLAMAAALAARMFRPTVSDVQDLETQVGLPTFAVIPDSGRQRRLMQGRLKTSDDDVLGMHRLLARAAPKDPAVESLRALHLSLALRSRAAPAKTILITSPSAGAGKTFVAANLAALMAKAGKRVVLLDTDLRKPGIYRYVGLDGNFAGLSDVLRLKHRIDDVVQRNVFTNLDVILHGRMLRNPAGLLLSVGMEQILATLRERYDHIVIDSAPLLPVGDTLAVGRLADFAMVVVRAEESSVRETREAVRRLDAAGLRVEGLLCNGAKRARFSTPTYGYGVTPAQGSGAYEGERAEHTIVDLSYCTQG
jgi:tyrosine-protein kinase Etk/Wzc